jgi:hypothetical protein
MTVEQVGERAMIGGEAVWCVWMERVGNKQVVRRDTFPPVTLEPASKSTGIGVVGLTRR